MGLYGGYVRVCGNTRDQKGEENEMETGGISRFSFPCSEWFLRFTLCLVGSAVRFGQEGQHMALVGDGIKNHQMI